MNSEDRLLSDYLQVHDYDERVKEELTSVKARVAALLLSSPKARNDDTILEFEYLRKYCGLAIPFVEWEKLREINLETVRRTRQKIQEDAARGISPIVGVLPQTFLPTDPVVARRRRRMMALREAARDGVI